MAERYAGINQNIRGYLPSKPLKDLQPGDYDITAISAVTTKKWGVKVVAELNNEFAIWMPAKVKTRLLADEQRILLMMQEDAAQNNLILHYIGGAGFDMEFKPKNAED